MGWEGNKKEWKRRKNGGKEKAWKGRRNKSPRNKFLTTAFVIKEIFPLMWASVIFLCF